MGGAGSPGIKGGVSTGVDVLWVARNTIKGADDAAPSMALKYKVGGA